MLQHRLYADQLQIMKLAHIIKPAAIGLTLALSLSVSYYLGVRAERDSLSANKEVRKAQEEPRNHSPKQRSISERNSQKSQIRSDTAANSTSDSAETPQKTPSDLAAGFAHAKSLPLGPMRNKKMLEALADWALRDGEAALAAANKVPEVLLRQQLKNAALRSWATVDPKSAYKTALANANGDLPENRMSNIFEGIGKADITTALAFFERHSNGQLMPYEYESTAAFDQLYQRGGHDILVPWVERLKDGKMKDGAVNRIIDQWARYDPPATLKWMDSMLRQNPENTIAARIELTESWARVNPLEAIDYVNNLPANQQNNAYFERIYKRWLEADQSAAADFLANQPPSPSLDKPFERYAYEVMYKNPAATMPWVESISDPVRRWKATERVAEAWRTKDPNGLEAYVTNSPTFNATQKAKLLKTRNGP